MRRKGSAERIASWVRQSAVRETSEFILVASTIGDGSIVARWEGVVVAQDNADWARMALETAQNDCDERGQDTRYDLKHLVSDSVQATHVIRCKPADDDDGGVPGLDGSFQGILAQQQRHLEATQRLMFQVVTTSLSPLQNLIDHQQKRILQLEGERTALLDALPETVSADSEEKQKMFFDLLKEAMPFIVPALLGSGGGGEVAQAIAEASE